MNLPLVIDIALGLVFIYLILSLLTSEIQELVAIVLQWRAEHLKKSILNLLEDESLDRSIYSRFTNRLYDSPLIQALNQEAKGLFALFFRTIIRSLILVFQTWTNTKSILGKQQSAPSYIPAETFATALIQQTHLEELIQRIGTATARQLTQERVNQFKGIIDELAVLLQREGADQIVTFLDSEYQNLRQSLRSTLEDVMSGRTGLSECLDQVADQFIVSIDQIASFAGERPSCETILRTRLSYLKQTIMHRQLDPTVTEILRLVFRAEQSGIQPSPWLKKIVEKLQQDEPDLFAPLARLPSRLQDNLLSLANKARLKTQSLEAELRQLEKEIAVWFDHSMERASGVYRRNAKGVGILIGFLVAIAINADTLYMVSRLSKDTLLRSAITQTANDIIAIDRPTTSAASPVPNANNSQATATTDLQAVKQAMNTVLDELPLPLGWDPVNVQQQQQEGRGWLPGLRPLIGWLVTGIALSMGASFWYDLLSKFIRVRGTGDKPGGEKSR
jgi:hypothetical protein